MTTRPGLWRIYSWCMIGAGLLLVARGLSSAGPVLAPVALFCLMSPATHVLPIKWSAFTVTLGPAVDLASAWLLGPEAGTVVAIVGRLLSSILVRPFSRRGLRGLRGEVPSMAASGVAAFAAGALRRSVGGSGLVGPFLSTIAYFLAVVLLTLPGSWARFGSNPLSQWWSEWAEVPAALLLNFGAGVVIVWLYNNIRVGVSGLAAVTLFLAMILYSTRMYVRMSEVYRSTVETLVPVIEAKFPDGVGHSRRVASLAVAVARKMAFRKHEVRRLFFGAMLHDVGMAAVDERVFLKKTVLSGSEYLDLMTHPIEGANIVSKSSFLTGCAEIVLHHHEKFDGSGLPYRLTGEEIPLGARIVAIAEAYDAMTHPRPYSRAMAPWEALEEIRAQAGRQFDPAIIPFMEQAVREQLRWGEHVFEFNYTFDIDR